MLDKRAGRYVSPSTLPNLNKLAAVIVGSVLLCAFLLHGTLSAQQNRFFPSDTLSPLSVSQGTLHSDLDAKPSRYNCPPLDDEADDILVVLKTGATETYKLLPHVQTLLQCVPRHIIVSDLEQDIYGLHTHDVLSGIEVNITRTHDDFEFYRQIQTAYDKGESLAGLLKGEHGDKEDNVAWKLDKWKFLPMIQKAARQSARWYIFIEADTYLVWSNLIPFLSRFDSSKPHYIGAQVLLGSEEFAHGGSGIVLSEPAVRQAAKFIEHHKSRMTAMVDERCCGDQVLGALFAELKIRLYQAWPSIQGETPSSLDYSDHHWCFPAVTYHHVDAEEITQLWDFEQQWISSSTEPILHRDAFARFVQPDLANKLDSWDNRSLWRTVSEEEKMPDDDNTDRGAESPESCWNMCQRVPECVQFLWEPGKCVLNDVTILGSEASDKSLTSGWFLDRIEDFKKRMEPCSGRWMEPIPDDKPDD